VTRRLASLRDRPASEDERRAATVAVLGLVLSAVVLLGITHDPSSERAQRSMRPPAAAPTISVQAAPVTAGAALSVAHGFLPGYLAYAYRGAPATKVADATRALIASLEDHPPRVTFPTHESLPRVLNLRPTVQPSGQLAVTAVVNDGGIVNYTVGLLLTRLHGRLMVAGLESQ
jgi:hypothetical protein